MKTKIKEPKISPGESDVQMYAVHGYFVIHAKTFYKHLKKKMWKKFPELNIQYFCLKIIYDFTCFLRDVGHVKLTCNMNLHIIILIYSSTSLRVCKYFFYSMDSAYTDTFYTVMLKNSGNIK